MRLVHLTAAALVASAGAAVFGCGGSADNAIIIAVAAPTDPVRADGKTAASIAITVTKAGKPLDGGNARFTSNLDGSAFTPIDPDSPPDAASKEGEVLGGAVTVKLYSIKAGSATVNVTYTDAAGTGKASKAVTVEFGNGPVAAIAKLQFVSADPESIGLKRSGRKDFSTLIFAAKDATGGAIPAGATVTFAISQADAQGKGPGGSTLSPASAKTDDKGLVSTVLSAGDQPATVTVKATAAGVTGDSNSITMSGSAANYRNFSWGCEELAIAGFAAQNLQLNCTALVADRSTQKVPGQQVTFLAEAGAIDRLVQADELGVAVAIYRTQDPKPVEVPIMATGTPTTSNMVTWSASYQGKKANNPPFDSAAAQPWYGGGIELVTNGESNGEPSRSGPCGNKQVGTCNPRDGLVSIIAVTSGEEQWDDLNKNGTWDTGEDFIDLPEPFIDVNDDGKYDIAIERDSYIDVNKNGKWDPGNGVWDGNTTIWKTVKIVWTGVPNAAAFYADTRNPPTALPNPLQIPHCNAPGGTPVPAVFYVIDANLNFPANLGGDTVACECADPALCTGNPQNYGVHDNHFGRKPILVGISDAHICQPIDCLKEAPPTCGPGNSAFRCSGTFNSIGGFSTALGAGGLGASLPTAVK